MARYDDLINEARDLIRTPQVERDLTVFNRAAAEFRELLLEPVAPIARLRELEAMLSDWFDSSSGHAADQLARRFEQWLAAAAPQAPAEPVAQEPVLFYEREFYPLSNFSAFRLHWKGYEYDTSEAAYQCEKFHCTGMIAAEIRAASSAHIAFKVAERNRAYRRPDWDAIKVDVMREILRAKSDQHEYVRRKLLETGERELIEDSWRDDYWGWGPNRDGQNMLGELWMEVRAELRGASPISLPVEVPREPTPEMYRAAHYVSGLGNIWKAMYDAAQKQSADTERTEP
jgi:ribA/ribD-fused uncharacterized protein